LEAIPKSIEKAAAEVSSNSASAESNEGDGNVDERGEEILKPNPNAPPAPPPPPVFGSTGGPPPPPGMGGGADLFPPKPKLTPSQKMKQIQWNKLAPTAIKDTIWMEVFEEKNIEEKIRKEKIDIKEFENLFTTSALAAKNAAVTSSNENIEEKKDKKMAVILLDSKRSNNVCKYKNTFEIFFLFFIFLFCPSISMVEIYLFIYTFINPSIIIAIIVYVAIMISRIKMSYPEVRKAILTLNEDLLPDQLIKQFLLYIPTPEESDQIHDFISGDESKLVELGKAEQFFYEVNF